LPDIKPYSLHGTILLPQYPIFNDVEPDMTKKPFYCYPYEMNYTGEVNQYPLSSRKFYVKMGKMCNVNTKRKSREKIIEEMTSIKKLKKNEQKEQKEQGKGKGEEKTAGEEKEKEKRHPTTTVAAPTSKTVQFAATPSTVSSPGADAPFKVLQQYQKNIGRNVKIITNNDQTVTGKLIKMEGDTIEIEPEKGKKNKVAVPNTFEISNIKEIKVIISFK
jgi:small nuclear ribonucleoprotein (snRNP)-like protein